MLSHISKFHFQLMSTPSRENPMGLLVALDDEGFALGELFWDDGEGLGKNKQHFAC